MSTDDQSNNIPVHLGLILDGNRRWATERGLPAFEGHRRGYDNFKKIAEVAIDRGVEYLTAYVFSIDNWSRPAEEVDYLMNLFHWIATHEVKELDRRNVKLRFIGSMNNLSPKLIAAMEDAEAKTAKNSRGTLALCLNYGGQEEIVDAVRGAIEAGLSAPDITADKLAEFIYTPDLPPVDLVIRTSGEQRTSGFMLWRAAYAELLFVDKYWPDFSEADLDVALADYASRQRRFGK